MAYIERRESGRWRARYRAPDGRERSKTFARKVDAQRFLGGVETDKSRGEWIDSRLGRTRFEDFAGRWMVAVAPTLKPKTVATYQSLLRSRVQPTFGDWPIGVDPAVGRAGLGGGDARGGALAEPHTPSPRRPLARSAGGGPRRRRCPQCCQAVCACRNWRGKRRPTSIRRRSTASSRRCPSPTTCSCGFSGRSVPDGVRRLRCAAARSTSYAGACGSSSRPPKSEAVLVYGQTKSYAVRQVPLTPALLAQLGTHLAGVAPEPEGPALREPQWGPAPAQQLLPPPLAPDAAKPRPPRGGAACPAPLGRCPHDRRRRVAQGGPGGARAPLGGLHPHRLRPHLRGRSRRLGRPSRRRYGNGSQDSRGLTAAWSPDGELSTGPGERKMAHGLG